MYTGVRTTAAVSLDIFTGHSGLTKYRVTYTPLLVFSSSALDPSSGGGRFLRVMLWLYKPLVVTKKEVNYL
jgi:hypothetical protein